jgi:tRNA (guanine-N7-)-methyltransferase
MDELLPKLRFDPAGWKSPAWLEIGFGGGEHLAHQAELHPDINFIGAEPFVNGVAKLLALIEEKRIGNIRIHDGDARELLDRLPDLSLERIYLLYPDPWPKARHNKRRFVSTETVSQIHRLLKPQGLFLFASDITGYVDWMLHLVSTHGGFSQEGDPAQPFADWIETRYEAKAKREGRPPCYLTFSRRS